MFDFGFWELAVVLVVALIVVGPDKLPGLAIKVGRWVGKAKQYISTVRADIESEIKAAELKEMLEKQQSEITELRSMLSDTTSDVENSIADLTKTESTEPPTLEQNKSQ
jgi:sec-independent protein translocase protein TatB